VYHLACAYEEGKQGPRTVLAVGAGFGKNLTSLLIKCFASMFGGGFVGAVIIVVVYRQRLNAKEQTTQTGQPFVSQR